MKQGFQHHYKHDSMFNSMDVCRFCSYINLFRLLLLLFLAFVFSPLPPLLSLTLFIFFFMHSPPLSSPFPPLCYRFFFSSFSFFSFVLLCLVYFLHFPYSLFLLLLLQQVLCIIFFRLLFFRYAFRLFHFLYLLNPILISITILKVSVSTSINFFF